MPIKISSLTNTKIRSSRASNAIKNGGSVLFQAYSSRSDELDTEINLSQTPGFQVGDATTTNATLEKVSGDSAQDVSFSKYIYKAGQADPLIYSPSPYLRLKATGANGTALFNKVTWDFSKSNYLYVVFRNKTAPIAAGDLKITLMSSVGNQSVLTSSVTSANANEFVYEIFEFQNDLAPNVAITGTPNFKAISDVSLIASVSQDVLDIDKLYFAQNYEQFPNTVLSKDLGDNCLESLSLAFNIETYEQLCALDVKGMQATGIKPEFTFTVPEEDILLKALAMGTTPKMVSVDDIEERQFTVTSGSISTGTPIGGSEARKDVAKVLIGKNELLRATSPHLIDSEHYYVNKATGAISVNTAYNNQTAKVTFNILTDQDSYTVSGNKVGYIGRAIVKMKENGRVNNKAFIAQIMPSDPEFSNDGDIKGTYMLKLIDDDGTKWTEGVS
jgi:hypothetical protein